MASEKPQVQTADLSYSLVGERLNELYRWEALACVAA
jgi:hypothetical protein